MGDLALDTAVTGDNGDYAIDLSRDWEIWGPNGGYVASIALRAAGAHSRFDRPASIVGHFLGVATFERPLEIRVDDAPRRQAGRVDRASRSPRATTPSSRRWCGRSATSPGSSTT